jgi:membrane-bound metal-dependent hydrolase YbcI (DUF457 family)
MIAGHFGLAAAVKAQNRSVPLWSLMLATVWLDIVFAPLLLFGVERIEQIPGTTGYYGNSIIYADYTHSLIGALVLSVIFALFFLKRWGRQAAIVIGAVVFSHWILDLVVHRADMPLLPGNLGDLPRLGLGAWRYPAVAAIIETLLVAVGAYLYWRAAVRTTRDAGDQHTRRPLTLGILVLASGLAVLALNFATA